MNSNYSKSQVKTEERSLAEIIVSFMNGVRRFWWLIIILAVLFGVFGYKRAKDTYVPMYQSKATISITAPVYNGNRDMSRTNDSELASELSVSFNYLINNDLFYEVIKNDLGVDTINGVITVAALEDTNILTIAVTDPSAQAAYDILNSVMNNYSSIAQFVLGDTEMIILEDPVIATAPINPFSFYKTVGMFAFIGIFMSMIPVIIYGFFVKTVKSKNDIEDLLSIRCFGSLPTVIVPDELENGKRPRYKKPPILKRIFFIVSKKARDKERDKVSGNHSILDKKIGFRYLEAVRTISSRCEKEFAKNNYKVILVTSTLAGEGKSTVSMNMALSLSKSGHRVMLIDGDFRKPNLRRLTNVDGVSYSMGDFLNKKVSLKEALINIADTRVVLIAADKPTPNPIEKINSDNMKIIIEQCRNVADYVIIDAPPCAGLADAAALLKYADAAVYVVREDYAKVGTILDTIQELSYTRKPLLGSVLNNSSGRLGLDYGYGYGYGYGHRYGYGYGYGRGYGYGGYGKSYGYGYGYGEYGTVTDSEFRAKERTTAKNIKISNDETQE